MSYELLYNELPAERLLLVRIEQAQYSNSQYCHPNACVVRRAVSHTVGEDGRVTRYADGHEAVGYRNCAWSKSTVGAIYVNDMQLRGQIDLGADKMNNGRPYGTDIRFMPYNVDNKHAAHAMYTTFTKAEAYWQKHSTCYRKDEDFALQVALLAGFLKITTLLFAKVKNVTSLSIADNYEECSLPIGMLRIQAMLQPFVQEPAKSEGNN